MLNSTLTLGARAKRKKSSGTQGNYGNSGYDKSFRTVTDAKVRLTYIQTFKVWWAITLRWIPTWSCFRATCSHMQSTITSPGKVHRLLGHSRHFSISFPEPSLPLSSWIRVTRALGTRLDTSEVRKEELFF